MVDAGDVPTKKGTSHQLLRAREREGAHAPGATRREVAYSSPVDLRFETRRSDSPWVDTVWTCTSEQVTEMTSVAGVRWGLVFWEQAGRAHASVTGPETRTGTAPVPEGATFTGIDFAVGTSLRAVPTAALVDGGIGLPDTTRRMFRLDGERWETPGPDDAEALVARLVRAGIVVRDQLVAELLQGHRPAVSERTVERRFRSATGLTRGAVRQIERARTAAELLAAGVRAADVVAKLDYFDEPHLARALRTYVGRTAKQLREGAGGAIALALDQRLTS
jgi:AraC-like DNA-binding protein